jgi:hypothetical protein
VGVVTLRPAAAVVALVAACLVSAWAGYLVGAQRSFGRLPYYTLGQPIGENSKYAVLAGWSFPEPPLRWSEGRRASILLRPRRVPDGPLVAELRLNRAVSQQTVKVSLNGAPLGTLNVAADGGTFKIAIPAGALRALEDNELALDIGNPHSPGPGDVRALGVSFESLRVREAAPGEAGR